MSTHLRLHSTSPARRAAPLRILFCGSDDFSIHSLLALHRARQDTPALIDDIHVAHRPPKPTGRGLKVLRPVPISRTAAALALPTHVFDTFTGFTPPFAYNLVVAVSFGLLVPPRILAAARYGGLNLHPSLLPDLRGSAPIEHAILKQRAHTGVSVQTLHPQRFDEGVVLAQTPLPGVPVTHDDTAATLGPRLAELGADMLVDVLKDQSFLEPWKDVACYTGPTDYAPKITKQHRFLDFASMHMPHILALHRALGDTWCLLPNGERLVMHDIVDTGRVQHDMPPGLALAHPPDTLLFRDPAGRVGMVRSSTYPGGPRAKGNTKVAKLLSLKNPTAESEG